LLTHPDGDYRTLKRNYRGLIRVYCNTEAYVIDLSAKALALHFWLAVVTFVELKVKQPSFTFVLLLGITVWYKN